MATKDQKTQEQIKSEINRIEYLKLEISKQTKFVPRDFNDWSYQTAVNFKDACQKAIRVSSKARPKLADIEVAYSDLCRFYY